ncbi:MAG: hypothetical protein WCF23_15415 [Candidatus Nitrosopolaris sp.]
MDEIKGYSLWLTIVQSFNYAARCTAESNPALGAGLFGRVYASYFKAKTGCGKLRFLAW